MLVHFHGVKVNDSKFNGYISSRELISQFNESWIPHYQRERIMHKMKISRLVNIFKENEQIDSVKLNFIGDFEMSKNELVLDGIFHVIDGQQRLFALKESGNLDIRLSVELFLNLPMEEEVELFHRFNKDASKLSFGDLAKSSQGTYGDLIRTLLSKKKSYPIPLTVNGNAAGIGLSVFCPILYLVHRKIESQSMMDAYLVGKRLLDFIARVQEPRKVMLTEYALLNVFKTYASIFGDFNPKATAYRRSFLLPCIHTLVTHFLSSNGKLEIPDKFKGKVNSLPSLLNNSRVRELVSSGEGASSDEMYTIIVDHFNFKLKGGHLPTFKEIRDANQTNKAARFRENSLHSEVSI